VARAAAAARARSVFVSSDYVFDGTNPQGYGEDDRVGAVNVYGVSKTAGEHLVRLADPNWLVVRGSGLFGLAGSSGKGGNFVETMLAKAAAGEAVSVVDDLTFSPTSTHDMAERLVMLLERSAPAGTYHVANAGACSWFELAAEIFRQAGVSPALSRRASDGDQVRRPRWSILRDTKTTELGLPPMRAWQDAVGWYLQARPARPA
jgi:dTDP-4-dehydrorhamnose reductase